MLPLLALHFLAVQRGDGLRPELLALLRSEKNKGLSASIEAESPHQPQETTRATEKYVPNEISDATG